MNGLLLASTDATIPAPRVDARGAGRGRGQPCAGISLRQDQPDAWISR